MAAISISKQIKTSYGSLDADYMNGGQPWASAAAYIAAKQAEEEDIPKYKTILVGSKEYWNPITATSFIEKFSGGSTPTAEGDPTTFLIKPEDWDLTPGEMTQNSSHGYSDAQYDAMYKNGLGISEAIHYAYGEGFRRILFQPETYCFCVSAASSSSDFVPQIGLLEYRNLEIDLGGSTLKLCVSDTQRSKYCNTTSDVWRQSGVLIGISYCRNLLLTNGTLVGDRFTRSYPSGGTDMENPGWAEQTYGIMPYCGCEQLRLENLEIREFMGDAICGGSAGFLYGYRADQIISNKWKGTCRSYEIPTIRPSEYYDDAGNKNGNMLNCGISDMFTNMNNMYYLDSNSDGAKQLDMRIEDRDAHRFTLYNNKGYSRMSSCYPLEIGILTYASNDPTAHPLRKINASYPCHFTLNPTEKYFRLLFIHEDYLHEEYDSSKTYNAGDRITRFESSLTVEFEAVAALSAGVAPQCDGDQDRYNWKPIRVVGPNGTATYNSSKAYPQGARVTANFSGKGACYVCQQNGTTGTWNSSKWKFVETARPCVSSISPGNGEGKCNLHITEYLGDGPIIKNCRIMDNHRGGIANLHFDTTIRDCYFKKTYHILGDGFPAPNYSGSATKVAMDPTIYHIDMEDFYSKGLKIQDCIFGDATQSSNKILLGCLDAEVSGCKGSALICAYAINHLNIHDNNFNYFEFTTQFNGNMFFKHSSNHLMPRVLLVNNNQLGTFIWRKMTMDNQVVRICNNVIYEGLTMTDTQQNFFFTSGDYVFENNTLLNRNTLKSTSRVAMVLDAKKVSGSTIKTTGSLGIVKLTSPMRGYMDVTADSVDFAESLDDRLYQDIDVNLGQASSIVYSSDPNGNTNKTVKFINCNFNSNEARGGYVPFYISGENTNGNISGRANWGGAQTVNLEFINCTFKDKSSGVLFAPGGTQLTGDKINFSFTDCKFNLTGADVANNATYFALVKYKGCTSNKTLKFNGSNISEIG